jgi:hypothetical protein
MGLVIILFIILIVVGIICVVCAVEAADEGTVVVGMFLIVAGFIGAVANFAYAESKSIEQCINDAVYQKGSQVRIKGIDKPATVISTQCYDKTKSLRTYEIATTDAVVLKVSEDNLENAR